MSRSRLKSKVRCSARHSSTTPRLLAKCAGRMLRTRTSSSRISWASCKSWASLSRCRSAGEAERGQVVLGLAAQPLGPAAALGHAEEPRVRQLAVGGVLADALAGLVGRPLHVEQVV